MRNVVLVAFCFGLLVVQSALSTVVPAHHFAPNLLLPVVIFLGVSQEIYIVRGAALSFLFGYLLDLFCGSAMGLMTFVLVATFILARFAGLRLFLRGPAFQVFLTFLVGLLAGGAALALRAIFERRGPAAMGDTTDMLLMVTGPALTTALIAPLVFAGVRHIEALSPRRREERALLR